MSEGNQSTLKGKLRIEATLKLETGLHIGASSDFAPIGLADSVFVRDPYTKEPVIPGSSLKGKMRTLLAKSTAKGYILNKIDEDTTEVKRLFGAGGKEVKPARLQFFDVKMTEESVRRFETLDTDTFIGEVKFENTLARTTAIANPRQIERVPAGAEFAFVLTYNIENEEEMAEDMEYLAEAVRLLELDYLGGHGSRGYGRVSFRDFRVIPFVMKFAEEKIKIDTAKIEKQLEERCAL